MSEEKLNQEERELDDIFEDEGDNDSNDSAGDGSDGASGLTDEALKEYNERIGKNYKSWDDVAKSERERDRQFAQGGEKKEPVKAPEPSVNDEVVEELLLTKHPEAEHVLDDLRSEAKRQGKSVLKLYRESKYFQGEAKALSDEKAEEEANRKNISKPSSGTAPSKVDIEKVKPEDVDKLKPSQKLEWLKRQAERERMSAD